jgi:hypothetical protein
VPSIDTPRSASRLLADTFALYRRYPLLFLVLAAGVVVPYELIVLAAGGGGFTRAHTSAGTQLILFLADLGLVIPLVSALHIHAVAEVRQEREPRIGRVALQGLRVLPVVAAAAIASWLGMALGFLLLIVPGVILWLRWSVVAQTAAIEHEGWLPSLRRSRQLTTGHYGHVAAFLLMVGAIGAAPGFAGQIVFGKSAEVGPLAVGLFVHVVVASFTALAGALLYYDLLGRWEAAPAPAPGGPVPSAPLDSAPGKSLDSRADADADRPPGWYVDPASPNRMRYWGGSEQPEWSGRARTPRKIRGHGKSG